MDTHFPFFTIMDSSPLPRPWSGTKSFSDDSSIIEEDEEEEEDDVEDLNHIAAQVEEEDSGVRALSNNDDYEIGELTEFDEVIADDGSEQTLVRRHSVLDDDNYELL